VKNKKKRKIWLIIIICILVVKFTVFNPGTSVETFETSGDVIKSDYEGNTIYSGYLSDMRDRTKVITTYKDFQEYCEKYNTYDYDGYGNVVKSSGRLNELVKKYDKKYFEKNSLALVYVELNSGSNCVEFVTATKDGNSTTVMYKIVYPEGGIGTSDMSGYIVYAEVDKDITNIITY
jgi:hypothetical protein